MNRTTASQQYDITLTYYRIGSATDVMILGEGTTQFLRLIYCSRILQSQNQLHCSICEMSYFY